MIRFGKISEVDNDKGLFRVSFPEDKIVSPWMSGVVPNTKETKYSSPYDINEHVVCLMDDHGDRGVILGAIYSKASQPTIVGGKHGVEFSDGTTVEFDPATGKLTIDAQGEVAISAAPKVTITGNLEVSGFIKANGEVTAKASTINVSLSTHIHPTPSGASSAPTPGT